MSRMEKIVIIGSPGAGKSTFAQALGDILKTEVIHLDRYFWQPGWKEYPRETRIEIEQQLIRGKDRWIIEGTYLGSSDSRLNAADTIIFLDMSCLLCLWRAVKRYIMYQGRSRPDMPDGCTEKLRLLYILKVLVFPHRGRDLLLTKIKEIQSLKANKSEKKCILTFRFDRELEDFLQRLFAQQQEGHAYEVQRHLQEAVSEEVTTLALPEGNNLIQVVHRILQQARLSILI